MSPSHFAFTHCTPHSFALVYFSPVGLSKATRSVYSSPVLTIYAALHCNTLAVRFFIRIHLKVIRPCLLFHKALYTKKVHPWTILGTHTNETKCTDSLWLSGRVSECRIQKIWVSFPHKGSSSQLVMIKFNFPLQSNFFDRIQLQSKQITIE